MNKKLIIGIIVAILAVIAGAVGYFILNRNDKDDVNDTTNHSDVDESLKDNTSSSSNSKTLIVYYSATGSTKKVADQLSEYMNADLFEIVPEDIYTSEDLDWTNENSRVSKEHDNESLRDIKLKNNKVENWESYDTVLIGYPIWWGVAAWPVNTFVKSNDFTGKTVIPFCTSASSGLGQSGELLAKESNTGRWKEGKRFSSGASSQDIKSWVDDLK